MIVIKSQRNILKIKLLYYITLIIVFYKNIKNYILDVQSTI